MSNEVITGEDIERMKDLCLKYKVVRKLVAGFLFQALRTVPEGHVTPEYLENLMLALADNTELIESAVLLHAKPHRQN